MAGKQVLVVDDELAVRELVDGLVRLCGHNVQTAASGAEALEHIERAQFDLVITDLHMPGMKGDQLASEIKLRRPELPIVLITGDCQPNPYPAVDRVLLKPFSIRQLKSVILELL